MSVEIAIDDRLRNYNPVTNLVAATKIRQGQVPPIDERQRELDLPLISFHREGDTDVLTPSGDITLEMVTIAVSVYASDEITAERIRERVHKRLKGSYDYSEGRVLISRKLASSKREEPDGSWVIRTDYMMRTQEPV